MPPTSALVTQVEDEARQAFRGDCSGHDWEHTRRVREMALRIADDEGADTFIVELAALLHDVADFKRTGSESAAGDQARAFLVALGVEPDQAAQVADIISAVSFKGSAEPDADTTKEGRCVRDADRLDALGAIGIARAFAYGATVGRNMHDPSYVPHAQQTRESYRANVPTTIGHFYEKLLLLQARMSTATGRRVAERRTAFMRDFLHHFSAEWVGQDADGAPHESKDVDP